MKGCLASPLAGVLIINCDRPTVLAIGTMCWALSTAAVGVSQQFHQVAMWRAGNGFGLAIVIPALQSFIADSYMDGVRGTGFGLLSLVGTLGGIDGGGVATVMAGQQSWVGINHDAGFDLKRSETWTATKAVIKVPTFQIIVLQGVVGSLPWTTTWFELIGCDHNSTGALLSVFAIGCAMGSFLGGLIADSHNDPTVNEQLYTIAVTLFLMGLTISWNATAANGPMFAKVVPSKNRTMIHAFSRALQGSLSSFAAPLVCILSEKMFG
ncbi:BES1/BZR1-like protein 2-like [Hibiscus syriacus]|uniref:BES1/BZR1-like protein 2-like n=1 Tax=Hibiscus syriacus TaxID=106335 RepID=A0A6A2ZTN1_HIBSY|nr:BES1/BZR1-like protein 2-like [Hibiscus syriacus]